MDDVKSKIEKLLAMANDGRGNEFEAEAALRQARKLMAKHNIDAAELSARTGEAPRYNWHRVSVPAGAPKPVESLPAWFSQLALGIARFTDCHVSAKYIPGHGACASFGGDEPDVIYAVWIAKHLRDTIRRESADYRGTRSDREDFRLGMAGRLIERMRALKAESDAELREARTASGTALAVVDNKIAMRDEAFGVQRVRQGRGRRLGHGARDGRDAGNSVGFGRPVGQDRRAIGQG